MPPRQRRASGSEPVSCVDCLEPTSEPRRRRCQRCYMRLYRERAPTGTCALCPVSDPRMLVIHRVVGVVCANHAKLAGPRITSLDELRALCAS